jgi:hypothetical protein
LLAATLLCVACAALPYPSRRVMLWMYTVNATAADFDSSTAKARKYAKFVNVISPTL